MEEYYELTDMSGSKPQKLGTISWNGSDLEFKPQTLRHRFEGVFIQTGAGELSLEDGLDFIKAIPHHYRSGYVSLRRVG